MSDDVRRKILARRSKFVMASLVGASLSACAGCCERCLSVVCLSIPAPLDEASTSPPLQPCLEPPALETTSDASVPPQVCLSIAPPKDDAGRALEVCLSVPIPKTLPPK